MTNLEYNFQIEVFKCLDKAFKMYNITSIDYSDVIVHTNVKGRSAGNAGWKRRHGETTYFVKFNMEAVQLDWDESVNSTIPHEVAHIICYLRPELGKNHDAGFRRVATALGDIHKGATTHSMSLTRGRAKVEYQYDVHGHTVMLGPKRHSKLQNNKSGYSCKHGSIKKHMFVKKVVTPVDRSGIMPAPNAKTPAPTRRRTSSTNLSKREQAEALYTSMRIDGHGRQAIIAEFISQIGLTKAGASTYYYNCQKKIG